jgi:hypothetical protein
MTNQNMVAIMGLYVAGAMRASGRAMKTQDQFYQIRVEGHLGSSWATWFEGMDIHHEEGGETTLTGPIRDQAALHGVLMRIRDLGLPLVAVRRLNERKEGEGGRSGIGDELELTSG